MTQIFNLTTHGEAQHKAKRPAEYGIWVTMRQRCLNPRATTYAYYGGRGISVCERWLRYENFLADMGRRPSPKHSIDRIDNDANYEPNNCRWVERWEQSRNRRRKHIGPLRKNGCFYSAPYYKKIVTAAIILVLMLMAIPTCAQTTTVTGSVHDLNGNAYANGTASAYIVLGIGQPLPAGATFSTGPVRTNSVGAFTITLFSPATYQFTLCAPPVNIGPTTNPTPSQICFSSGAIAISGASQDVSVALNAVATQLGPQGASGASVCALFGVICVDGVTNKTLAAAVTACAANCVIYDTLPETFTTDPLSGATGKNIAIYFQIPGTWVLARSGNYGMTVPSNVGIFCSSPASIIQAGNATNYTYNISMGGFAGIPSVSKASLDNCTLDGNAANNLGGTTTGFLGVAGGFNGGGRNRITRNEFINLPSVGILVGDVNVAGVLYPSQRDWIEGNAFPVSTVAGLSGCGQHCIKVVSTNAAGGFFYTRIVGNTVSQAVGFGIELVKAEGVITAANQLDGLIVPSAGTTATVNTTNSSITGCASNGVTFTSGTDTGLVGADTSGSSGSTLKINRLSYFVSHIVDSTHLCVVAAPGTQTGVAAYGGSLELIHHDTTAYGLTTGNILRNCSDNCMSFINQTGGLSVTGYKITGNSFSNCGGACLSGDATTGAGLEIGNDISGNTSINAGQGQPAEAAQFDSCIRFAGALAQQNQFQGNTCLDLQGSPTTQSGIALDGSIGAGNLVGFNAAYNMVAGPFRGGGGNASSIIPNGVALQGNQSGGGVVNYSLITPDSGNGVTISDVAGRRISLPSGPTATGTAAGLTGTGACATITTQSGGSWGGKATCTGTTGASTLVITPGITAPNGWNCKASYDSTTQTNVPTFTFNTSTCTLTFSSVTANDVIVFSALPF